MPTPCNVSGTLQTLNSGNIAQGTVIFQLSGYTVGSFPRVLGTSILPATTLTVMTNQQGNFALTLWGNDNIDPTATVYLVTFRDYLGNEVGPITFSIVGASFNLNSAAHS